jgi:hypothetical protein
MMQGTYKLVDILRQGEGFKPNLAAAVIAAVCITWSNDEIIMFNDV